MKNKNQNIILRQLIVCLIFVVFFQTTLLKASHILGAEITYKHIEVNKYKFFLTVYRDCNECKFNANGGGTSTINCNDISSLMIRGSEGTNYSHIDLSSIELVRKEVVDVTNTCISAVSKCKPNSSINYGFEKHLFEGEFDFSNLLAQNYCMFDVSISISSRNIKINTTTAEQNFYNYASLVLCSNTKNKSVQYTNTPNFLYSTNQSYYLSSGVVNPDNDSLSFKLKPAKINRLANVSYASGRNYNEPFSYFCLNSLNSCGANTNTLPYQGFYISNQTGDIAFTPIVNNQGGVIVIECEEWKKNSNGSYFLAGITRRDIYAETVNSNNNLPIINVSQSNISLCSGEFKVIDIETIDLPFNTSVFDDVTLSLKENNINASLELMPSTSNGIKRYFLKIEGNSTNIGKHLITIEARDNQCPINALTSRTIVVDIKELPQLSIQKSVKNCGELTLQPTVNSSVSYWWTLKDINGQILKQSNTRKLTHKLLNGGNYISEIFIPPSNSSCERLIIDTFKVDDFRAPVLDMGPDFKVCKNTNINIVPQQNVEEQDGQWFVNNVVWSRMPFNTLVSESSQFVFKYKLSNGCFGEDVVKVGVYDSLIYNVSDIQLCLNKLKQFNDIEIELENINDLKKIELFETDINLVLNNPVENKWNYSLFENRPSLYEVNYVIEDKNSCVYNSKFNINILDTSKIDVVLPQTICTNQFPYSLPKIPNGKWYLSPNFINDINDVKRQDVGSSSNFQLIFVLKENLCESVKSYFIDVKDTTEIDLPSTDNIKLCENFVLYNLEAQPENGLWYGIGVNNNQFELNEENKSLINHTIYYRYKSSNGCVSTKDLNIEIVKLPYLQIYKPLDSVCYGDVLDFQAETKEIYPGYWYTNGFGRFNSPNDLYTTYYPSKQDVQLGLTNFLYTIQTNGPCGNVSKQVSVFIKDGPIGTILDNYSIETCEPAKIVFSSSFNGINSQKWYVNDSLIEQFDYEFPLDISLKAGEYIVKTSVKDGSCSATAFSKKITVLPKPSVEFYSNPNGKMSVEMPRLFVKDMSYCKYGHFVNWYYNDSLINNKDREFSFLVNKEIQNFNIKLVAQSLKGSCKDSIVKQYQFVPIHQLFIPDAFSPDLKGPEQNNVFKVYGPMMKKYNIEIFNRFGEKVFYSNDMTQVWDGYYNGKLSLPGVYFYKIITVDIEGFSRDYSGTVTLLR